MVERERPAVKVVEGLTVAVRALAPCKSEAAIDCHGPAWEGKVGATQVVSLGQAQAAAAVIAVVAGAAAAVAAEVFGGAEG